MFKKLTSLTLAALMALSLAACSSGNNNPGGTSTPSGSPSASQPAAFTADLQAFYDSHFGGEDAPAMAEVTDEMLEGMYPGLSAIERTQTVAYMALMSATACEAVLIEVANAADVEAVKAILQARIDAQVGTDDAPGGAWYPDTIQAWKDTSEIVVIDNYVCLFVSADKDAIVSDFRALG